jgi:hypothetical protein
MGIAFELFAFAAKEIPALYARSPWQDDPYDGAVSFALFFVPPLVVLIAGSAFHCRRETPLASGRARGLWRASAALLAVCGATVGVEWISVLLGTRAAEWDATTLGLTLTLAGVSALVVVAGVALAHARWHRASPAPEHRLDRRHHRCRSITMRPNWLTRSRVVRAAAPRPRCHSTHMAAPSGAGCHGNCCAVRPAARGG